MRQSKETGVKCAGNGESVRQRKGLPLRFVSCIPLHKKEPSFFLQRGKEEYVMKIKSLFEWKSARLSVRSIAGMAMLCALYVVLNMFSISLSATLEIRFSFIALALSCALYGFLPNLIFCFVADLLGFLAHPTGPYMPFYAMVLMVKALIYTLFFYGQKNVSVWRIVLGEAVAILVCNVILTPLVLTMLYGTPYWILVTGRLLKNLIAWPLNSIMLFLSIRLLPALSARTQLRSSHAA